MPQIAQQLCETEDNNKMNVSHMNEVKDYDDIRTSALATGSREAHEEYTMPFNPVS